MAKLTIEDLATDRELDRESMREIAGGARRSGGDFVGGLGNGWSLKPSSGPGNRFGQGRGRRFRRS